MKHTGKQSLRDEVCTMRVGVECGQRWWRLRSWRVGKTFRKFNGGFAIGPIMFWRNAR